MKPEQQNNLTGTFDMTDSNKTISLSFSADLSYTGTTQGSCDGINVTKKMHKPGSQNEKQ